MSMLVDDKMIISFNIISWLENVHLINDYNNTKNARIITDLCLSDFVFDFGNLVYKKEFINI